MEYGRLKGIVPDDYAYPGEFMAFKKLESIPYVDVIFGAVLRWIAESNHRPTIHGDCYQVTEITNPHIYGLYRTALERLDMSETYPLYLDAQFNYNASAIGGSAPYIVVNSSIIQNFSDEEILAVLGHEIAHIKGKHLIYVNMANLIGALMQDIPMIGKGITVGFMLALTRWERMHEFTCDRAGCIAAGSVDAGINAMRNFLGVSEDFPGTHVEIDDLMQQSSEFDLSKENVVTAAFCGFQLINIDHPWTTDRIKELVEWKESGEFERLISKFR